MLVYREQYWYNSGITPKIGAGIIDISKRCAGFKTGLIVYGVGDHGGGPTRRDVERALEMMEWPVYPKIKFGTFREFFHEAESVRDELPLVEKELNFIFQGCYTTQSRIKLGNRACERALTNAEAMSAFAAAAAGARTDNFPLEKSVARRIVHPFPRYFDRLLRSGQPRARNGSVFQLTRCRSGKIRVGDA